MLKQLYDKYKHTLDKKVGNGTLLVFIIAILIILIGVFISSGKINYKSNVLERKNITTENISFIDQTTIKINNKLYSIILKEME